MIMKWLRKGVYLHGTETWDSNGVESIEQYLEEKYEEEQEIVKWTVAPKNTIKKITVNDVNK